MKSVRAIGVVAVCLLALSCAKEIKVGPEEAREIARDAYIYGLPMVDNYRVMYSYAVYRDSGAYKAPFNRLAIVMPDTTLPDSTRKAFIIQPPYALSWIDLRKEAAVLTVPPMHEGQTFHIQLVDLYTHNFAELGTTKGSASGSYMVVQGPWNDTKPDKITDVLQCETAFALVIIRGTPLHKGNEAMDAYLTTFDVETLSAFNGEPAKKPDALIFPPYSQETARTAGFFQYMNFVLQFCPVHPSEIQERARFAKLGIAAGKHFDVARMNHDLRDAVEGGMNDGRATIAEAVSNTPPGAAKYGPRDQLKNDYLARAAAAKIRLYGSQSP